MAQLYFAPPHHACIISAPDREAGLQTARELAAGALCLRGGGTACGQCRSCRKIREDIHPDVQFIRPLTDDRGREKKEITVDQVRTLVSDACLLPHEAEGKVYIIDRADRVNIQAQNAALKLLEEPPKGVWLLLCTANPWGLLPTVRSRCVFLNCAGTSETDGEQTKRAMEYLEAVSCGDAAELCAFCFGAESMSGAEGEAFLRRALELTADMLTMKRDSMGMSRTQLGRLRTLLERAIEYTRVNTGIKHILGLLAAASIDERQP